jgi:hypothetical protein
MPSVRITRRIVDPITFSESVGLEFVPRGIEDSILDETIGMTYALPPHKSALEEGYHSPPPSPVPDSSVPALQQLSDEDFSPESDVEVLSASDFSSSSSEDEEELPSKLVARPPSPPIPASPDGKSPRKSPRRSPSPRRPMKVLLKNLQQNSLANIMESFQKTPDLSLDDDASLNFEQDLLGGDRFKPPLDDGKKHVRFADEIDVKQFSRSGASVFDDLYYASQDLAEFRYAAFMEDAGLDIAEYD